MGYKVLNWSELATDPINKLSLEIVKEGLEASNPYLSVLQTLSKVSKQIEKYSNIVVIGFGKASYNMALACEESLIERISGGAIIVPHGSVKSSALKKIEVLEGTHPVPTELNVRSVRKVLSYVEQLSKKDLVVCLVSGGGSALFTLPAEGITLRDKQEMTRILLAAGPTIQEINCIRKHISAVKGGQLAKLIYPAHVLSLILSDVVGDDPSSIASGPTAPDPTTFKEVLNVFERYQILENVPNNILNRTHLGLEGRVAETPKPNDKIFENVTNMVVANNMKALTSMAKKAESAGLKAMILTSYLEGEAREVGKVIAAIAKQIVREHLPLKPPCSVFFGGETTVTLRGKGRGGRNQEVALSTLIAIKGLQNVKFVSFGSDGVDGNSDAAGAIVDGTTFQRALEKGLYPNKYLEDNDSNTFFKQVGGLIITGPTGTNVNDLSFLIVLP
ncbi:MAG: glycerate kinase [Nitrososphaeria archaeon]